MKTNNPPVRIKKYVRVKEAHKRFWVAIKDQVLRVLVEDQTEMTVRAEDGEQYILKREAVEVINPKEAVSA